MNSFILKLLSIYLLTVMHSKGLVTAAAKDPATNPHQKFIFI